MISSQYMPTPFLGEIRPTAILFAPQGWALCNGALLNIQDNPDLFSLIGTYYGGDGEHTFRLPDLQGRVPVHTNNNDIQIGQYGGEEEITLQSLMLPEHTHTVYATNVGNSDNPAGNFWGRSAEYLYSDSPGTVSMNSGSITYAGGGLSHENRIPFVAINYIIAMEGIYPR
jgi:microcystin-dependent protein